MSVKIYHNPDCKTSCTVLKMLRAKGHDPIVIDYLNDPPGKSDLIDLLNHLRLSPWDIVRKKDAKSMRLTQDPKDLTGLITAIAKNPMLIEAPIVVTSTTGRICRPATVVNQIVGTA
jgi:arsenate reductase